MLGFFGRHFLSCFPAVVALISLAPPSTRQPTKSPCLFVLCPFMSASFSINPLLLIDIHLGQRPFIYPFSIATFFISPFSADSDQNICIYTLGCPSRFPLSILAFPTYRKYRCCLSLFRSDYRFFSFLASLHFNYPLPIIAFSYCPPPLPTNSSYSALYSIHTPWFFVLVSVVFNK